MRVVFLDIDGVLVSGEWLRGGKPGEYRAKRPDPERVAVLFDLLDRSGAVCVLSSTWRYGDWRQHLPAEVVARIIDCTPDLRSFAIDRGHEIAAWLAEHPEVEAYVILDDDADMLPEQMPRLVQTRFIAGLTAADAERVVALLAEDSR